MKAREEERTKEENTNQIHEEIDVSNTSYDMMEENAVELDPRRIRYVKGRRGAMEDRSKRSYRKSKRKGDRMGEKGGKRQSKYSDEITLHRIQHMSATSTTTTAAAACRQFRIRVREVLESDHHRICRHHSTVPVPSYCVTWKHLSCWKTLPW